MEGLAPSRLAPADLLRSAAIGLRTRRLRTALSALGIAIGIASMVAVLGISDSSRAGLIATLDRLGTNLLRVSPGQTVFGEATTLPSDAEEMIRRIAPVQQASAVTDVSATVRRTDLISELETGGIAVKSADPDLLATIGGTLADGRFLDEGRSKHPVAVLGSTAAERLGIRDLAGEVRVYVEGRWFTVIGILDPLPLAPDLDRSVLIGRPAAQRWFDAERSASTVYVRADPDDVEDVRGVLAATANPEHPEEVEVSRPSDALEARKAARDAFTSLLLGLGAVALLVGGVGIANVLVIGVLERRQEIGLRRALGATRRHVWTQFVGESIVLAGIGGVTGSLLGTGVTTAYASVRGWDVVLPVVGIIAGVLAAIGIGALAGVYPAARAARSSPTEALRSV